MNTLFLQQPDIVNEKKVSSTACSIAEPIKKILDKVEVEELSFENLEYQLKILKSLDSKSFFCGDASVNWGNWWLHVWFVNNYKWIHELSMYWDDEACSIAHEIVLIIQKNFKEHLQGIIDQDAFLDLQAINESLSDYWKPDLFLHGFTTYIEKLKWNVDVLSEKWYPET